MRIPLAIWFTGLPGSGKTTLSRLLSAEFQKRDIKSILLDGDDIRKKLNKDLGFSMADRLENIRRVAELDNLLLENDISTINAFITPTESSRDVVRRLIRPDRLLEVFLDASLMICEKRDPKGLYRKARQGAIVGFTGIDAPFERPSSASLEIDTGQLTIEESLSLLLKYLDLD